MVRSDVPDENVNGRIRGLSDVGDEKETSSDKTATPVLSSDNKISPSSGDNNDNTDHEDLKKKIPYPKSVFFIIGNEFCERFSYYGLRTILAIYLKNQLHFDSDTATVIYHVFIMFCYFFPVLGAILADSFLGKFRTIFYLSVVYAIGNIVVSIAAVPDLIPAREFTMVGLVLIALGTGGIKPCVSAFGGDQFVVPQQEKQLQKFFSLFYFSINAGSFISTFLTPVLREDVTCFDMDTCYSLAFGVPAALMVVSLVLFLIGKKWYKTKTPEGNVLVEVTKLMWHAARSKDKTKHDHWLDKGADRFSKDFIDDVKMMLRVLVLYIPLPIFWALFDQQGSRWTFQANRMSGDLGGGVRIKPDQMQVVNPILILVFIPCFETVVYPLCAKCNFLKRPLQRLTVGGVLAALAFVISAVVETQIEPTYPVLPEAGSAQLRIYNGLPCEATINSPYLDKFNIEKQGLWQNLTVPLSDQLDIKLTVKATCIQNGGYDRAIHLIEAQATSATISMDELIISQNENVDKSDNGDPTVMVIYSDPNFKSGSVDVDFYVGQSNDSARTISLNSTKPYREFDKIDSDTYTIKIDSKTIFQDVYMEQGGAYTFVIVKDGADYLPSNFTVTNPNTVNMLWLIPQYFVITAGEVMFSITGLEFSFTQAPVSMKSVLQAMWLITVAIGNLVVIIVAEAKIFSSQTYEFLLFAGLMFVDMIIFALMAMKYTYVEDMKTDKDKDKDDNQNLELTEKEKTED